MLAVSGTRLSSGRPRGRPLYLWTATVLPVPGFLPRSGLLLWRIKGERATLLHVVLRTCTVAVKDIRDVEHSIEVTAETLYESDRHGSRRVAAGQLGRRDRSGVRNGDCSCPAATRKARSENEGLPLMAQPSR